MWVGTFHYIQDVVQDCTEHLLDAARYPANGVVSSAKGASANHDRVHKAEVSLSWLKRTSKTD